MPKKKDPFLKYKDQIIKETREKFEKEHGKKNNSNYPDWMKKVEDQFQAAMDEAAYKGWKMTMEKNENFAEWELLRLENPEEYNRVINWENESE